MLYLLSFSFPFTCGLYDPIQPLSALKKTKPPEKFVHVNFHNYLGIYSCVRLWLMSARPKMEVI